MAVTDGSKIFIKNKQTGKYLFFLRDDKSSIPHPNKWDLLGGGMKDGETPQEAVEREIKEETNISIYNIKQILKRNVTHIVEGKEYNITSYIFVAYTDAPINEIKLYEGRKIEYFTLDEIKKKKVAPTILDLIYKVESQLT